MTALLLALVLGAPLGAAADAGRSPGPTACSVAVLALDPQGRVIATRAASAARTPAMVFRARVAPLRNGSKPLLFDVFNPRGQRYQILFAEAPRRSLVLQGGSPGGSPRPATAFEARLPVAGSSIALTSMLGRWRVEPRLEGQDRPCGAARTFTIDP